MHFPFNCPGCGYENYAEWSQIGKQVVCGGCGRTATVPAPMEVVGGETESGLAIRFTCPACGRNFATKPTLAGQKIRCTGCGGGVRVPGSESIVAVNPSRVVLSANSTSSLAPVQIAREAIVAPAPSAAIEEDRSMSLREQLASVGGLKRRRSTTVALPSRAETMEQVRQEVAEQEAVATQKAVEKAKRAKKKKHKKSGYFDLQETLILVGGVSVVVGVLSFLAWFFPDFRYPLGGLLAAIGFFCYFLGAMSLRQIAYNEGFFKMMLYRFFPPYQLWFVVTRWADTQDYFAFFASGLIIMGIGVAVIKTSETSKRADANEQEYQLMVDEFVRGKDANAPVARPPAAKQAAEKKPAEKEPAEKEPTVKDE
jgi:hypothetical protein